LGAAAGVTSVVYHFYWGGRTIVVSIAIGGALVTIVSLCLFFLLKS
jgi:hypothetical protein